MDPPKRSRDREMVGERGDCSMGGASLKSGLRTTETGDRAEHLSQCASKARQGYARNDPLVNDQGQTTTHC